MMLWRFRQGNFFVCPVWSWPRKTRRLHETMYALGPFRYRTFRGLRR